MGQMERGVERKLQKIGGKGGHSQAQESKEEWGRVSGRGGKRLVH